MRLTRFILITDKNGLDSLFAKWWVKSYADIVEVYNISDIPTVANEIYGVQRTPTLLKVVTGGFEKVEGYNKRLYDELIGGNVNE